MLLKCLVKTIMIRQQKFKEMNNILQNKIELEKHI